MKKYKIILNPTSSRGKSVDHIPTIKAFMEANNLPYDLELTTAPNHATEIAKQAHAEGYTYIIAAGGDGTSNEVLNGIMYANQNSDHKAIFGLLPVGSGNDMAFGVGVRTGIETALEVLRDQNTQVFDVGYVRGGDYPEGRYFGNGLGVGFDAIVGFEAAKLKFSGFIGYLISALKTIILVKPALLRLELDDQTIESRFLMISIMNGQRAGGGFMLTPDADTSDGEFSVCIANEMNRLSQITVLPKFIAGTHTSHPKVDLINAKKVTVTALDGTIPSHIDGETVCEAGQKLEIEILPQALHILQEPLA